MSSLTLGTYNLAPRDTVYIRALVRLFSNTEKLHWSFSEAPPFDVVITEPANVGPDGQIPGMNASVLNLVDRVDARRTDAIEYPIRANQFRDWLKEQAEIRTSYSEPMPEAPVVEAPVASAYVSTFTTQQQYIRYQLRRWPSAALLASDPMRIRMATLLSRKAYSAAELVGMTDKPLEYCVQFVRELFDAGLLLDSVGAAFQVDTAEPPAKVQAEIVAAPVKTGLFASIRRRFGL